MSSSNQRGRSAINGQFVTVAQAKRNPKTTVIETIKSTVQAKPGNNKPASTRSR